MNELTMKIVNNCIPVIKPVKRFTGHRLSDQTDELARLYFTPLQLITPSIVQFLQLVTRFAIIHIQNEIKKTDD